MSPIRAARLAMPVLAIAVLFCIGSSSLGAPGATELSPPVPTATEPSPPVPTATHPQGRILLGAYVSLHDYGNDEKAFEEREQAAGRHLDLQLTYYNWDDQFPDFGETVITAHGRTPLMAWYGPGKDPGDHRTLAEVVSGQDDAWIMQQARAIKAFGTLVYLSPMPEMNGSWYHGFSGDPVNYVPAWRHIHDLFEQVGVTNVKWVWRPNIAPSNWDRYYPGDAYVDVIGVDGYNTGQPWVSFQSIFEKFFQHYAGRKPILVGETATDAKGGNSAGWINDMRAYLENTAGPKYGVMALCWFDTDTDDEHDWRVDQTPQAWQAWIAMAKDPVFGGHG